MGQPLSIAVSLWAFFPFQRSFISLPLVARTGVYVSYYQEKIYSYAVAPLYYLSDALKNKKTNETLKIDKRKREESSKKYALYRTLLILNVFYRT